jgi:glycine cleavage system aminomethyltransferase T
MFSIYPSARLRPSPFFEATVAEGVTSFTTYNNMLMPTGFGRPEEEYWRLINGVSMWDVAVERQVQLRVRMRRGWRRFCARETSPNAWRAKANMSPCATTPER